MAFVLNIKLRCFQEIKVEKKNILQNIVSEEY